MPPWVKGLLVVTLIAIGVVLWVESSEAATKERWSAFHRAAQSETSLEDLEDFRTESAGSELEPYVSLELALQLFERGDLDQVQRAAQVASEALAAHPGHEVAEQLEEIRDAASTYAGV